MLRVMVESLFCSELCGKISCGEESECNEIYNRGISDRRVCGVKALHGEGHHLGIDMWLGLFFLLERAD